MRRGLLLGLVGALLLCANAQAQGLTITGTQALSPRLTQYTATSPALGMSTNLRVLLPDGYSTQQARKYPVLLLLHGCCDDYRSWVDKGRAEQLSAPYPLIVVMPDGGSAGWYSDPYAGGPPKYETYAFDELLPWVDSTFRTTGKRAVAGLSMGGFGALKYAARHPGVFEAAASYSGVVDAPSFAANGFANLIPDSVWGPRATDLARWREHNPLDLAANLRGLKLIELRTGNGDPGPLDTRTSRDNLELEVSRENAALHAKLDELQIPHVYDDYGPGVHDWPYWARGLEQTLRNLVAVFPTTTDTTVGGTVPATLSLQLGAAPSFGTFTPGTARTYTASTTATVTSTAGEATLVVSDPSSTSTGHLVNGTFALPQPLQGLGTVKTYTGPISGDEATITFRQDIGANDALRTGTYAKTLTFTLSTTAP
jgi:S-formylglutathione hydrolase FrmB